MDVYIPINERSRFPLSVTEPTICKQNIDINIIKIFYSLSNNINNKWKPIVKEVCKKNILESNNDDDFVVINDCEFTNLYDTNFYEMRCFLINNTDYGAVSLYSKQSPDFRSGHVCAGLVMFKKSALKITKFDMFPNDSSCISVMKSLNDNGWKYGYLDDKIRCLKCAIVPK